MSMAVSVDACATDAESLLRFGAYTSILLGSQMLWWAGVAECAPIGSEKFGLISKLNRRISTWAQPLMLPVGPALPPLYRVHAVWSTSSITFPPLGGVAGAGAGVTPRAPGSSPSDLIRFMDEELLAVLVAAHRFGDKLHLAQALMHRHQRACEWIHWLGRVTSTV